MKSKIALYVLLIFATLVPAVTFVAIGNLKLRLKQAIEKQETALVAQVANELNDKIQFAQDALVSAAAFVTPDIVASRVKAETFLDGLPALNSIFDNNILIIDTRGRIVAESGHRPSRTGFDLSFREYISETLKQGKPYISRPFVSSLSHQPLVIIFTTPVRDASGKIIAIFGGSIDLAKNNFIANLATASVGKTGYFFLFDKERTIIVHPNRKKIMKRLAAAGAARRYDLAVSGVDNAGEMVNADGRRVLSAFKSLQGGRWIVGVDFPVEEAYAPVRQAEKTAFVIMAVGAVIIVGGMWLVMRHVTLPLLSLTDQIREMERRKEYRHVSVSTQDEIQELGHAFNSLMDQLRSKEERLYYMSTHDTLTGLYNRAFFETETERVQKGRLFPVSIVAADLDGLKQVNDAFGHAAGDAMIQVAAEILTEAFRDSDVVARVGGDEFVVLLPATDAEAANAAVERIKAIADRRRREIRSYPFSISVGTASAETGDALQDALRIADMRMYAEKAARKAAGGADSPDATA